MRRESTSTTMQQGSHILTAQQVTTGANRDHNGSHNSQTHLEGRKEEQKQSYFVHQSCTVFKYPLQFGIARMISYVNMPTPTLDLCTLQTRRSKREPVVMAEAEEDLYCLCRRPYQDSEFMIECDICKDWFHGRCVAHYCV